MASTQVLKIEKDLQETDKKIKELQNAKYDPLTDPVYKTYSDQMDREGEAARHQALMELSGSSGYINSYAQASAQQLAQAYNKKKQDIIPTLVAQNRTDNDNKIANLFTQYNTLLNQRQIERDYDLKVQQMAQAKADALKTEKAAKAKADQEALLKAKKEQQSELEKMLESEIKSIREHDSDLTYTQARTKALSSLNSYINGTSGGQSYIGAGGISGNETSPYYNTLNGSNGVIMGWIRKGNREQAFNAVKNAFYQGKITDSEVEKLIEIYKLDQAKNPF